MQDLLCCTILSAVIPIYRDNPAFGLDYKYYFKRRLLFEKDNQNNGDCTVNGRFANTFSQSARKSRQLMKGFKNEHDDTFRNRKRLQSSRRAYP